MTYEDAVKIAAFMNDIHGRARNEELLMRLRRDFPDVNWKWDHGLKVEP